MEQHFEEENEEEIEHEFAEDDALAEQVLILDDEAAAKYIEEHGGEPMDEEYSDDHDEDDDQDIPQEDVVDESITRFIGHENNPVYTLAVSPLGTVACSGGGDDQAFLWSLSNPSHNAIKLAKHTDSVVACAFNFDGSLVATGGMDGVVMVFNAMTGAKTHTFEGPSREIEFVKFHPSGNVILAGSADSMAWMFDCSDGSTMAVFSGHQDTVSCGSFTSNGRRILTGSADGTLKLWEPTGQLAHTFSGLNWHTGGVVCLSLHPDGGPNVVTGSDDGTACVVKLDTKKVIGHYKHSDQDPKLQRMDGQEDEEEDGVSVEAVAFCKSHPWLATAGTDSRVLIWDLVAGSRRAVFKHDAAVISAVWFDYRLCTASADGLVREWDARTGNLIKSFSGHTDAILDMALTPDSKHVISGGDDGTVRVFALVA